MSLSTPSMGGMAFLYISSWIEAAKSSRAANVHGPSALSL